jgi:L-asparaginase
LISVLLTGGTIASTATGEEGRFAPHVADPVKAVIEARSEALGLAVEVVHWRDAEGNEMQLVDSCDMRPHHWLALSQQIDRLALNSEAVVVLHGTDTLAYTASALSLLSPRRSVPVVLTGAQVAVGLPDSDAGDNIALALRAAAGEWGDVDGDTLIAFGQCLMRGVRASKFSTSAKNGFGSRAVPLINLMDPAVSRRAIWQQWQAERAGADEPSPVTGFSEDVIHLEVQPGKDWARTTERLLAVPPRGLLLSLYGTGSSPLAGQLAALCDALADRGCPSVAVSASPQGAIVWQHYAATQPLEESALIDGGDMTTECAITKLMAAAHLQLSIAETRAFFASAIAGERTLSA